MFASNYEQQEDYNKQEVFNGPHLKSWHCLLEVLEAIAMLFIVHAKFSILTFSMQPETYNRLHFFVEDQIYWAPATTTSDLYAQLASKKYREIHRNQIT